MALDFFTPIVPAADFHPAFRNLLQNHFPFDRNIINHWADGFVDRDRKIVKEFQTSFDSSFWEIYLFAACKELGLKCDFTKSSPDFCVVSPEALSIEAVVSSNAKGAPTVAEGKHSEFPKDLNEFNRQAMIRLLNSLQAKYGKFINSYSKLEHVKDKPFVIAIAPFDQPNFQLQGTRAIEAVLYRYYVDEESFLKADGGDDRLLATNKEIVVKDTGTALPMGLFSDGRMSGLSAVIHSTSGTWSKVTAMSEDPDVIIEAVYENRRDGGILYYQGPNSHYKEHLLDGLRVYHNPYADHPLNPELFPQDEIFQATSRGVGDLTLLSPARRLLVCRRSMRFPPGMIEAHLHAAPPDKSFWHSVNQPLYRENRRPRSE
jgi:hypothetical protein